MRGLTLLDALIGLGTAVFLMAVLGVFVLFQNRKLGTETRTAVVTREVRAALDLLAGDLREAGRRQPGVDYTGALSPPGLCVLAADRVRLTADFDGDGETTGPGEDVTYCHCPGSATVYRAWRNAGAGSGFTVEPLAGSVSAFTFQYGARSVSVSIATAIGTPLGSFAEQWQTAAFLRNRADAVTCGSGPVCPPPAC